MSLASSPPPVWTPPAGFPPWGTLHPASLAGIRAPAPHSPRFGYMYGPADGSSSPAAAASFPFPPSAPVALRHVTDRLRHLAADGEGELAPYGYTHHDGRRHADHAVVDTGVGVRVSHSWVAGPGGVGWSLRVRGRALRAGEAGAAAHAAEGACDAGGCGWVDRLRVAVGMGPAFPPGAPTRLSLIYYAVAAPEEVEGGALAATAGVDATDGSVPWGTLAVTGAAAVASAAGGPPAIGRVTIVGNASAAGGAYALHLLPPAGEVSRGAAAGDRSAAFPGPVRAAVQQVPLAGAAVVTVRDEPAAAWRVDALAKYILSRVITAAVRRVSVAAAGTGPHRDPPDVIAHRRDSALARYVPRLGQMSSAAAPNVVLVQRVLPLPFEVDAVFVPAGAGAPDGKGGGAAAATAVPAADGGGDHLDDPLAAAAAVVNGGVGEGGGRFGGSGVDLPPGMTGSALTARITEGRAAVEARVEATFRLAARGEPPAVVAFARTAVANLLGGLGFFYGSSVVRRADAARFGQLAFPPGAAPAAPTAVADEGRDGDSNGEGNATYGADSTDVVDGATATTEADGDNLTYLSPVSLFTATPSRASFPRGFLWDEGFHQLLIRAWDPPLSAAVGMSWVAAMRAGGWIPREQILGVEARGRFPAHVAHLLVQSPAVANPPTLLMLLRAIAVDAAAAAAAADRAAAGVPPDTCAPPPGWPRYPPSVCRVLGVAPPPPAAAVTAYAAARALVNYLSSTQAGTSPLTYRWRGRSTAQVAPDGTPHTLASGLDDFPRGRVPHDDERHADLAGWVAWSHGLLAKMAAAAGAGAAAVAGHAADRDAGVAALTAAHAVTVVVGAESGQVAVVGPAPDGATEGGEAGRPDASAVAEVAAAAAAAAAAEGVEPEPWHPSTLLCDWDGAAGAPVCHDGYAPLLPVLLGVLPASSPAVAGGLAAMGHPARLAGTAGLRSLSAASPAAGTADGYWTGPVWVPFSYLAVVAAARAYPHVPGAAAVTAGVRQRLVANAVAEWARTGYVWEVYDGMTGEGRRGRQFCGWSALVVLAAAKRFEGVL
ncbi:hypothetical protein MMPV_003565 [Pyropia vietnamensis]